MAEQEGVIKYQLDFAVAEPVDAQRLRALQQWRLTLYQLGLIGQDPERYGGLGYGNISQRCFSDDAHDLPENSWADIYDEAVALAESQNQSDGSGFLISGTQTGHLSELTAEHYALVNHCDPLNNYIIASGPVKPSSEALTHGAIYALSPDIQAVIHVHSPEIFALRDQLLLPSTPDHVPYGTPDMANAVRSLWSEGKLKSAPVLVMGGHQDGVISFGRNMAEAGMAMLNAFQWARALRLAEDAEAGHVELVTGF